MQFLKTLDSVQAKLQQFQTSMQSLYIDSGLENVYKGLLDFGNNVIKTFTAMPKLFNLPILAISKFGTQFASLAMIVTNVFSLIKAKVQQSNRDLTLINKVASGEQLTEEENAYFQRLSSARRFWKLRAEIEQNGTNQLNYIGRHASKESIQEEEQSLNNRLNVAKKWLKDKKVQRGWGVGFSTVGTILSMTAGNMGTNTQTERYGKAALTAGGSIAQGLGMGLMMGGIPGAILGTLTALPGIIEALGIASESTAEKVDRLKSALEDTSNERIKSQDELKTLKDYKTKYEELYKARNDNNESYKEYVNLSNEIAAKYPTLIAGMDAEGNYVIDLAKNYDTLLKAKQAAYNNDFIKEGVSQIQAYSDNDYLLQLLGVEQVGTYDPDGSLRTMFDFTKVSGAMSHYFSELSPEEWAQESLETILPAAWRSANISDRTALASWDNVVGDIVFTNAYGNIIGDDSVYDTHRYLAYRGLHTTYDFKKGYTAEELDGIMQDILAYAGQMMDEGQSLSEINAFFQQFFGKNFHFNENLIGNLAQLKANAGLRDNYVNKIITALNTSATKNAIGELGLEVDTLQSNWLNDQVQKAWENSESYKQALEGEMDLDTAWQTFMLSINSIVQAANNTLTLYSGLTDKEITQVQDLYSNIGQYSGEDVRNLFNELGIEMDTELGQLILNRFIDISQSAIERFDNGMKEAGISNILADGDFFTDIFGSDQLDIILDSYRTILKNTSLTSEQQEAQINNLTSFYTALSNLQITPQQRAAAMTIVKNGDLTSLTGIYDIITDLQEAGLADGEVIKSLEALSEAINVNLTTELASFTQQIVQQVDNFDKALSNASKGMALDDAITMADKLGVSIDAFRFEDGKYFYDNAKAIREVYFKYNEELRQKLKERYDQDMADKTKSDEDKAALTASYEQVNSAIDEYGVYQVNAILIQNGLIFDFLESALKDSDIKNFNNIENELLKGDYSSLISNGLSAYIPLIMDYTNGIGKDIIEKAMSSFKGEGKQRITVNSSNQNLLEELGSSVKYIEGTNQAIIDLTLANFQQIQNLIQAELTAGLITEQQAQSYLSEAYDFKHKDNITEVLTSIIDNYESFGYDTAQSLANALGLSIEELKAKKIINSDSITGQFSISLAQLRERANVALAQGMDIKTYNDLISKIEQTERETTIENVMQDVIENRTSLTEENIQSLADALNTTYDSVKAILTENANGTFSMSLAAIQTMVDEKSLILNNALEQLIAEQIDNIISSITGLASNQGRGYTNLADMQKFVQQIIDSGISEINGKQINMQSLFEWNSSINAFMLTTEGIIGQVAAAKAQLDEFIQNSDQYFAITKFINDTKRQFAERIDVTSILGGGTADENQKAIRDFYSAVEDYNAYLIAIGDTSKLLNASGIYSKIRGGGSSAVATAEYLAELAGKDLSKSDVESIYHAQISPYIEAIEQVNSSIGSIVSREAAIVIGLANVQQIGTTGQYLVTSTTNLVDAYDRLYNRLLSTNEATLSDLNKVMALKLEAKTGTDAISALSNAAEMTYTQFGELLANAGYKLTEESLKVFSDNKILEEIGGGKLRITNFRWFADMMGWDVTSEQYISAFKSYNDAMIELNNKVERDIAEEVQNIASAKPGDQINITQLYYKLIEEGILGNLNGILSTLGATIETGILTIQDNANLPAIMQAIQQVAQEKDLMLANDLAALADAIDEALTSFAETLANGVTGTLNHIQANELKTTAQNMFGISLDFNETATGLKISTEQATKLYNQLQAVNNAAASIVFDSLRESLQEAGEDCENITKTMANIRSIEAEMSNDPKNDQLKERLNLYNQIAAVQMQDPDQYDFMGRSLPDYLQGPENYWNSIGQAFTAMEEAASSGYIGVADFYNIVNEMNNLAALGGDIEFLGMTLDGSLESASTLIQKGMNALSNVDGTGVKINLGEFGVGMAEGADMMSSNIEDGIDAMAQSQIDMLDGMIALLETVVAMEKLGNITGENHVLDLDEMFVVEGDSTKFTAEVQAWATDVLTTAETNKDLMEALDNIIFDGSSLRSILEKAESGIALTEEETIKYFSAINSLYQMFLSGDYDLDNLMASISNVASNSGFEGEIQIGDIKLAVGYGFTLESNEDGSYEVDGTVYTDPKDALQALVLDQENDIKNITKTIDEVSGEVTFTGTYTVGETVFEVINKDGVITYKNPDGKIFNSKREAVRDLYKQYVADTEKEGNEPLDSEEYAKSVNIDPILTVGSISITNEKEFTDATHEEITTLANALINGDKNTIIEAAANVGITVDVDGEVVTEAQRQQIAELAGIESKIVTTDLSAVNSILSTLSTAFSNLDATNLQACADAMSQLESSANSVMNINWDALVGNINAINTPSTDNSIVGDSTAIMRDITASVILNYTDAIAEELLKNTSISRTVVLMAETSGIDEALSNLSANVKVSGTNGANAGVTTPVTTPVATGASGISSVFSGAFSAIRGAISPITAAINNITNGGSIANSTLSSLATSMKNLPTDAAGTVNNFSSSMNGIPNVSGRVSGLSRAMNGIPSTAAARITALTTALEKIPSRKTIAITATVRVNATGGRVTSQSPTSAQPVAITAAKGNIALAGGRKKTLMGELGVELVVSNGHYYLVGQNGAEMVDLPDDAIVFNHLQTKQLLSSGMSSRGKAVTNERNATSMATGNVEGPAMASASAALSALKQIRAMWQSMLNASLKDLGQQAGSGGGGGGGGGKDKNTIDPGFIADLERWYNLLRQIERLEQSINYEEKLRQKLSSDTVSNGKAYYESQKRSLEALQQQIVKNEELSYLQKSYYDARRQDLANTNFGKIFTFDENGLMQYNDTATMANGDKGGLFALAKINAQNADNSPVYTAQEQYNLLKQWGFDEELKYDNEGKLIEWTDEEGKARDEAYTEAVQAFWDKVDGWKDELDGLYDSYNDSLNDLLDEEAQRNEILNEMRDNQLNLEQKVVKAIENREQKEIDDLQDERDALEDATSAYIDGLNEQLDRERQMYQREQEEQELSKLRRQLAILQRSGGSASQIRSLQNQIAAKEQDAYFNAQQTQIDAIQEASDKEMETLNAQLDVMKESLEYQKENGLLWREVSEVMKGTPAEIEAFLTTWSPDFQGVSPTDFEVKMNELKNSIDQWVQLRDDKEAPLEADRQDEGGIGWRVWATENQGHYQKIWNEKSGAAEKAYRDAYAINSNPIEAAAAARKVLDQALIEYYQLHPEEDPKNKDNLVQLEGTGNKTETSSKPSGGKGDSSGTTYNKISLSVSAGDGHGNPRLSTTSANPHQTVTVSPNPHAGYAFDHLTYNGKSKSGTTITPTGKVSHISVVVYYKKTTTSSKKNTSGGCFVAGTKIIMGDNSIKNIEDVLDNEFVLAYNTKTGIFEPYRVIKSYSHFDTPRVIDITLSDGTVLGITPGHPILTTEGWKSRDQIMSFKEHEVVTKWLNLGDEVLQYGKKARVVKIKERKISEHYTTYNLWVDECHTYIADGVIVHNAAFNASLKKYAYSKGGLADYTGLAMVHGTKKRPEAFLNATETKMWKEDILSGRKGSLTNSLIEFQTMVEEMTATGVSGNTTNNNGNIIIERAEVNVNAEVANDYDARRIGQNALEEMVKIARKSSVQSIRR